MKDLLLSLYIAGKNHPVVAAGAGNGNGTGTGDVPSVERNAPGALSDAVSVVLGIAGWAGTAAGVAGIIVCGIMMAVSMKRGEGSEHISRLGMVLGGCILVACAGPAIEFFFNESGGGEGGVDVEQNGGVQNQ